jgi:hypothetical protein
MNHDQLSAFGLAALPQHTAESLRLSVLSMFL